MADTTEQILFELKLDSAAFKAEQQKVREALQQVTLDIERTRAAQKALETTRKAGKVGDAEYSAQAVKLREELNRQRADLRELEKGIETSQRAYGSAAGSVSQLRAALLEAKTAFYEMSEAERSSAEGQSLQQQALAISDALSKVEKSVGQAGRDTAKYGEAIKAALTPAAGSVAALRAELAALQAKRETISPTTKEAQELNTQILETKTRLQQSLGVIDEWGERVQKNIRRENFDTVRDAITGAVSATAAASIVFGENSTAAKAQARALQALALSQEVRNIAIGIGSAREAASIVLTKARNLLVKEQATVTATATIATGAHTVATGTDAAAIETQAAAASAVAAAQAAGTEATVVNTVATEAQAVATTSASVASRVAAVAVRALGVAMSLTPIGLLLVGLAALVGATLAYSNASTRTQERVNKLVEALFRYTTPIGLAITGTQKLYDKFAIVRTILDPAIDSFKLLAGWVERNAKSSLEYLGILDTQLQKQAKLAAQNVELAEGVRARLELEARAMELAGERQEKVRAQQRAALVAERQAKEENLERQERMEAEQNRKQLQRIAEQQAANEVLSDKDKEFLTQRKQRQDEARAAELAVQAFDQESAEIRRAARAAEAADEENNDQRKADNARRRLAEANANEKAALQTRLSVLDRSLALVQRNSDEELDLQRRRIQTQRDLDLANLGPTLAQERALRARNLSRILADQKENEQLALAAFGLTEQQRHHIIQEYRNKAADLRQAFSTAEAQREVKARQDIAANAAAAELAVTTAHLRQQTLLSLQAEQERNAAALAGVQQALATEAGLREEADKEKLQQAYTLQRRQILLERELAIAQLDSRTNTTAAELRIRAEANRRLAELDAGQADATRQRRARDLSDEAQHYNLLADGMLAGKTQAEQQYFQATDTYRVLRMEAVENEEQARLATVQKGSQEEANIRQEAANKLAQIQRDSSQAQLDLLQAQTQKVAALITGSLNSLAAMQDADSQAKLARIDAEMNKEGVSAARKAVLEKQKLRIEKEAAEQRKKFAKAQAIISLGASIMQILQAPTAPFVEPAASIVRAIEIATATATAYAQIRAIDSAKFAAGGIAHGPLHSQGGIQLTHRGRAVGIEIEGGEAVINRRSTAQFGPLLSAINEWGGGRPLFRDHLEGSALMARLATGGLVSSAFLPAMRVGGPVQVVAPQIDYERLTDMMAAKLGPEFVRGAQALPPQELNLTELQQRQEAQRRTQQQTDI